MILSCLTNITMKINLLPLILFLFICNVTYSQEEHFKKLLTVNHKNTACQSYTKFLIQKENILENDSIQFFIKNWEQTCNQIEPILRLKIIYQIQNNIKMDSLILEYYNKFESKIIDRIYDSRSEHYQEIYDNDSAYYDYVPLKSNFDSTIINAAKKLLTRNNLTEDEQLICFLFGDQKYNYNKYKASNKFKKSLINQQIKKIRKENEEEEFNITVLTGAWISLNEYKKQLGTNPQIGVSMGVPVNKYQFDLSIILRINSNSKDFKIQTDMDTVLTNSSVGLFFGCAMNYEIFSKKKFKILPKISCGIDLMDTDVLKEFSNEEGEEEYYHITTFNLGFGCSFLYAAFDKHSLGVEINYHYVPYSIDRDLLTVFTSDFISVNLIYRFW